MKEIASQFIRIDDLNLQIAQRDLVKVTNKAGTLMYKYVYWKIKTPDTTYNIGNTEEYKRIVKAMNAPNTRFVRIENDLVNILQISSIIKKSGYLEIEEKP